MILLDGREWKMYLSAVGTFFQTAELAAAQEKQMEVCDVCGAFLIVGDAQQRIDDHLMGKQHVGYARLKSALQEIMVCKMTFVFRRKRSAVFGSHRRYTVRLFNRLPCYAVMPLRPCGLTLLSCFTEQTRKGSR